MKIKVKVIGDYAVGDEKGKLITKPQTLALEEDEAKRLEARKIVEIVSGIEDPQADKDSAQESNSVENQGDETAETGSESDQASDLNAEKKGTEEGPAQKRKRKEKP